MVFGLQMEQCLPLLTERLNNETTRVVALRALIEVVRSPLHLELSLVLAVVLKRLADFLKKTMRVLKVLSAMEQVHFFV